MATIVSTDNKSRLKLISIRANSSTVLYVCKACVCGRTECQGACTFGCDDDVMHVTWLAWWPCAI